MELDTATPHIHYAEHKAKYPPGQVKVKASPPGKAKGKEKNKGKGKGKGKP